MDPITAFSSASVSMVYRMVADSADIVLLPFQNIPRGNAHQAANASEVVSERRQGEAPAFAMLPLPEVSGIKRLLDRSDKTGKSELDGPKDAMAVTAHNLAPVGRLVGNTAKGFLVDLPLAMTEGLRAVPKAYGAPTKEHGSVEGFRSGVSVAGKTFANDMAGGLTDVFKHTYHGKREEGAAGAAKGLGKGAVSFLTKTSGALLGLVAFPAQGVYRSIWSAMHGSTRGIVTECKLMEGDWLLAAKPEWQLDPEAIGHDLDGLGGRR